MGAQRLGPKAGVGNAGRRRAASGKIRTTPLPDIPPHFEIKVTLERLGARSTTAHQLRQLGQARGQAAGLVPGQPLTHRAALRFVVEMEIVEQFARIVLS